MQRFVSLIFISICITSPDFAATNYISGEQNSSIIKDGYKATIQQFPYQVYLFVSARPEDYQCGGSIISKRHVLTSALCLQGASKITARLGSTYLSSGGTQYTSRNFKSHPLFDYISTDYNVGFVRFKKLYIDGINTKIVSLALKKSPLEAETILTVSGWGETADDVNTGANLIAVDVHTVSNEECRQFYLVRSRMFCAGQRGLSNDSSEIRSGDPAVSSDGVQRGLVSFEITDLRPGVPGLYTRIGNQMIRSWIKINTGV